jgi:hypothetical protein
MWQHYRKTLPFVQGFILIACLFLRFYEAAPFGVVATFFVMMQIGSLLGALWAMRLKQKIQSDKFPLPLRL